MATWVGVGSSRVSNSLKAGQEAAKKALEALGQRYPDLVLVFASVCFDQETLLKGITAITQDAPMAGCSTAGEILSEGPSKRSVVVMAIRSDTLQISTGLGLGVSSNPRQAGQDAATRAVASKFESPHAFIIFPEGLAGNGAEIVRGMQEVLGLSFPIVGGSSADDFRFSKTHQYYNGKVYSDAVVGILMAGPIHLGIGARHGWKPLGKPREVTKAVANTVQELDGHSAVNLYETYFGKRAATGAISESLVQTSIVYPLGLPIPGEEEYLLRNVLRVDRDGSLVYAGEIPEGSQVRLMMGSKEKALDAARRAAELALASISPHPPRFGLVFSSCSRARLFGRQSGKEVAAIQNVLGPTVPLIGFYGYGEQAPLTAAGFRGRSYFHNESVVVVAVCAP